MEIFGFMPCQYYMSFIGTTIAWHWSWSCPH